MTPDVAEKFNKLIDETEKALQKIEVRILLGETGLKEEKARLEKRLAGLRLPMF